MAKHDALRRKIAELEELASNRGGLDLSKLSANQRARYDARLSAEKRTTYEQLLECDSPTLDQDVWRALWGETIIAVTDTERTAADKWQKLRERFYG